MAAASKTYVPPVYYTDSQRVVLAKHAQNVRYALREKRKRVRETCARDATSDTGSPLSRPRISLRLHFEASKIPHRPLR